MKILVPLDGSLTAEAILPAVAELAGPLGAEVELLTVVATDQAHETLARPPRLILTTPTATAAGVLVEGRMLEAVPPRAAETREQAIERLEAAQIDYLRAQAAALPGITPAIQVVFADDPAEAIVARAEESGTNLIAMATHGHGGVRHLLTGSVTERVIRSGVAPVLTIRPETVLYGVDAG